MKNMKMEVSHQIEIEPLPQQFRASIPLDYKELRAKFDEFWEENMEKILARYPLKNFKKKKGYKKSPKVILEKTFKPQKLYSPVLTELFLEKIDNILFIEAVDLFNFEEDTIPYLVGLFYYIPELTLNCDLDELDLTVPEPNVKTVDEEWERRCKEFQKKHQILEIYEGDDVQEGHNALLDIMASCDGEPYNPISCRTTWHLVKDIRFPELKQAILEHKKGDLFEVDFKFNEGDTEKLIKAAVKIHELQTVEFPELDDELAKKEKFETFDGLKNKFQEGYAKYITDMKEGLAFDTCINAITQNSTIPIAPSIYVKANVSKILDQHSQASNGDLDAAARRLGLKDAEALQAQCEIQVQQNFIRDLAIRKYVDLFEVEVDTDNYDKAIDDMVERVEWIEPIKESNNEA